MGESTRKLIADRLKSAENDANRFYRDHESFLKSIPHYISDETLKLLRGDTAAEERRLNSEMYKWEKELSDYEDLSKERMPEAVKGGVR